MKEHRIVLWCDLCWRESEEGDQLPIKVEAVQSWTVACVAGDDKRPSLKVLDLCDPHGKAFDELSHLLNDRPLPLITPPPLPEPVKSHNPSGRPTTGGNDPVDCPVCQISVAYGSLITHIWKRHRPGEVKPPVPKMCPECRERFEPQGMSLHRKTHGHDALLDVLAGVPGYVVTGREREELGR
jgi:hypothetical protein